MKLQEEWILLEYFETFMFFMILSEIWRKEDRKGTSLQLFHNKLLSRMRTVEGSNLIQLLKLYDMVL